MVTRKNPELIDDENPEWTDETSARSVRLEGLPASLRAKLRSRGERGPQKTPTKIQTAVRYDADIIAAFKADGPGWQTRMNDALRQWLREHRAG